MALDSYVVETLMRDLVGHDRSPAAFIVYLYMAHQVEKTRRSAAALSLQKIAHGTGLSKSAVQGAMRLLRRRKLLAVSKSSPTAVPVYEVLKPWDR
jgi:DNA-binding transcriptional regulator GbsR (MarR family)